MFYDNLIDEVEHYKTEYFNGFSTENCNLIVCIENEDDRPFWEFIFDNIDGINPCFHSFDGKKNILKYKDLFDSEFVCCIDSDYDYILDKEYISKPFIFHTYFYAIENYYIYPKLLNELLKRLNLKSSINFNSLFLKATCLMEKAFLYDLYLIDKNRKSIRDKFKFDIKLQEINEESILSYIENQISKIIIPSDIDLKSYKDKIIEDENIDEKNLFLYIEGHIIFNNILNILKQIEKNIISSKKMLIKNDKNYTGKQKGDKIKELDNKRFDIKTALRMNYDKCIIINECFSIKKIIQDIKNSFNRTKKIDML